MKPEIKKESEPWYNFGGGRYMGEQPFFYEREKLPWTKIIEDNWEVIRDEVVGLMIEKPQNLKPYFINKSMSFPPKKWKTMGIYFWKFIIKENYKKCPETIKILKTIPGLTSFSLSVLEPGSNINPHQGDTDAIIRCHVGIDIPGTLPVCGFQVGTEIKPWANGITLPFCDAHTHTAWNHTTEKRLILILDVMREEYVKKQNSVCAHVLASSAIQMIYQKYPFFNKRSGYVKKGLYHFIRIFVLGFLPVQRFFAFL